MSPRVDSTPRGPASWWAFRRVARWQEEGEAPTRGIDLSGDSYPLAGSVLSQEEGVSPLCCRAGWRHRGGEMVQSGLAVGWHLLVCARPRADLLLQQLLGFHPGGDELLPCFCGHGLVGLRPAGQVQGELTDLKQRRPCSEAASQTATWAKTPHVIRTSGPASLPAASPPAPGRPLAPSALGALSPTPILLPHSGLGKVWQVPSNSVRNLLSSVCISFFR